MKFYLKGCEKFSNKKACGNLGVFYQNGYGVAVDLAKSESFLRKSCSLDDKIGCKYLAMLLWKNSKEKHPNAEILGFFKKSCDLGENESCNYYVANENDRNATIQNLTKRCEINDKDACAAVASLYFENFKDFKNTEIFLKKACDLKHYKACESLALMYSITKTWFKETDAEILKQNKAKAFTLFEKSCENNEAKSCYYLGNFYYHGTDEISQDREKAKELYDKSCSLNYKDACDLL